MMNIKTIILAAILSCSYVALGQQSWEDKFHLDTIISVFQFSESSIGLTLIINEHDSNYEFDNLVNQIIRTEDLWSLYLDKNYDLNKVRIVDSSSYYRLFYNKSIADNLSYLVGKSFYIYGQKGICKSKICDILIHLDECETNFILLRLDKIDASIGNPLFATKDKISISYERNIAQETNYNKYLSTFPTDYTDTIPETNFARWNGYLLFYSDTFNWYHINESCIYPSRSIILERNNDYQILWTRSLDLFGIPCD
jgi:hypothetical protein